MDYPKTNSLFKRSPDDHSLILNDYSCKEFELISHWRVEEKIDGTNVRIVYDPQADDANKITVFGRAKDSQMPTHLGEFIKNHITLEKLRTAFPEAQSGVILYGEGYGNNIQAAGPSYQKEVGFMLFDILAGPWWLTREVVQEKASLLQLPTPPDLGIMTKQEILELVQSKPSSKCSIKPQVIEGIVARTEPLMLFRNGKPIMWKLKVKDTAKQLMPHS